MTGDLARRARRAALVGIGGAVGALARVWLEQVLDTTPSFPLGILAANVLGALVIGGVLALAERLAPTSGRRLRLLVATGLCGGLTTLSSLALAIAQTADRGAWGSAVLYGALTIAAGLLAVVVGRAATTVLLDARSQRRRAPGIEGGCA